LKVIDANEIIDFEGLEIKIDYLTIPHLDE
jgi:hypothetical protein